MGIPSFFRHIIQTHKQCVYPWKTPIAEQPLFSSLYIDFNSIIHQKAAQATAQNKKHASHIYPLIFEECVRAVINLINETKPQSLVYIAVDGLCPHAKMSQQRKRRFLSAWTQLQMRRHKDVAFLNDNPYWDSNCVTPGTHFMQELDTFMQKALMKVCEMFPEINCIYSGSHVFGEGEHKIFTYMQENFPSSPKRPSHLIYGLDADLILLSLVHFSKHDIHLIRESPQFALPTLKEVGHNHLCAMDITYLAQALFRTYMNSNIIISLQPFINDYVVLCTFLGNDFLPGLSHLSSRHNDITHIMEAYKACFIPDNVNTDLLNKSFIIQDNGKLNMKNLKKIVKKLADAEDANFWQKAIQDQNQNPPNQQNMAIYLEKYPLFHKWEYFSNLDFSQPGWRMSYYQTLFPMEKNYTSSLIQDVCKNYFEGLQWVVDYYIQKKPLLDWYYRFIHSPTLLDFANFLTFSDNNNQATFYKDYLTNAQFMNYMHMPNMHLLMVLPPHSVTLIPDEMCQSIMLNPSFGCMVYYPHDFKLDSFFKQFTWECKPLIPHPPLKYIAQQYNHYILK